MPPKKGLGKGIDSLIPENTSKKVKKESIAINNTFVKISEIEPNKEQPRTHFNEDKLHELADSIKQHGIVEPLVVVKKNNY